MGTAAQQLKPALVAQFRLYDEYHRHETNRLTHKIAIPLIVFHIIAMLTWIPLGSPFGFSLTLGHVVYVVAVAWYLTLDVRLGALMALLMAVCFPLAAITPKWLVVTVAIVGWLVQLAGHVVWEKRQPAFVTNLLQALIGPLYFVATLVGLWSNDSRAMS
jgi:uncharacterized membrane protein YGL010W